MAELIITPVTSQGEGNAFVDMAWDVYRDSPLWVPPLKKQERELLTPGAHPYWEQAERELYLARRGDRIVGRLAAIVDHNYNAFAGQRCGAWGFFECHHDREAAHALFEAAARWHRARGMEFMRGPLNPSKIGRAHV